MKKWRNVDDVVKMIHDLEDEKLRKVDVEMRKKPNFDKRGEQGCLKNEKSKKSIKTYKKY